MKRGPKTGMERLLRLREVQVAQAQAQSALAEKALSEARNASAAARAAIESLAAARHEAQRSTQLDMGRCALLADSEVVARHVWAETEQERKARQNDAATAANALTATLQQRKAASTRHQVRLDELRREIESKQDGLLTDLWLNSGGR